MSLELKTHHHSSSAELIFKLFAIKKIASSHLTQEDDQPAKGKSQVLPWIIGIPLLLVSIFIFWGTFRIYTADLKFRSSLISATENQGTETYNQQRDAITLNPYLSHYRRTYAQTNLSIANALSQQQNPPDDVRQTISTLVQQAIREGRNAVIIEPNNPANWETLAQIYRQLINVADGSDQWAITSYANAIRLDPNNPRLRVELGGIYFQLENLPSASRLFEQAVVLKPDYPNAHYNLSVALANSGETTRAIAQYETLIQLLDPTSNDYTKALDELTQLRDKAGVDAAAATEQAPQTAELNPPQPLPTPAPGQAPIELTDEDAPPTEEEIQENQSGFSDTESEEISDEGSTTPEATGSAETAEEN